MKQSFLILHQPRNSSRPQIKPKRCY